MLRFILNSQSEIGAFPSTIHFNGKIQQDWNGFITAQVLRALNELPDSSSLIRAREHALDFLMTCESPKRPGAFSFWPIGAQPQWLQKLPADIDDTAVTALEMARCGRLDQEALKKIVYNIFLPHRLVHIKGLNPPWLRRGVFYTWLHRGKRPNVVDCCVNANVVALMAYANLGHLPGYREACEMIEDGVRWAGNNIKRVRSLVPFYPHPAELLWAVKNAVKCGVEQLEKSLLIRRELKWIDLDLKKDLVLHRPICGSAYGMIFWTSPVLQEARRLALA